MKKAVFALLALTSVACLAQSHMKNGYVRKDGTYVAPTMATNPNDTKLDNYSTKGNVNPYNGKAGTVDPYKIEPIKPAPQPAYQQPAQPNYYQQPQNNWYGKK